MFLVHKYCLNLPRFVMLTLQNDMIEHQGIVENINGSRILVKIVQGSACSSCSAKGMCSSAESKEKLIEVADGSGAFQVGDPVMIVGKTSLGLQAVLLAFVLPFLVLIVSLFVGMAVSGGEELLSALVALLFTAVYYAFLAGKREHLKKKFSFTIKPIK